VVERPVQQRGEGGRQEAGVGEAGGRGRTRHGEAEAWDRRHGGSGDLGLGAAPT
jgi:hypothetical protein